MVRGSELRAGSIRASDSQVPDGWCATRDAGRSRAGELVPGLMEPTCSEVGRRTALARGKLPIMNHIAVHKSARCPVRGAIVRVADHLDAIVRGGGWSFRTGCYSGKLRLNTSWTRWRLREALGWVRSSPQLLFLIRRRIYTCQPKRSVRSDTLKLGPRRMRPGGRTS